MAKKKSENRDPHDRYFTAASLAERIARWARIPAGGSILEPSAGHGALLVAAQRYGGASPEPWFVAVEQQPDQVKVLDRLRLEWPERKLTVVQGDFPKLTLADLGQEAPFDLALMNPPFSDGADGQHVAHALRLSRRVVALVRTNFEHTARRWHECLVRARITRKAVLVSRPPPFDGPGDLGQTPQSDYVVLELVRRETERRPGDLDGVVTEYWT